MSDSVRYAVYYGLNPCFDDLYQKSKDGYNFVHLMDLISSKENIMLAYRNIKSNKGSNTPGVDGQTIDDLRTMSVSQIVTMVRNKLRWYVPKPIRRVEIPKSSDPTKTRPLGIPCIIDRIVQECIKLVLEPIAEAKFYERSFGFRANRCCENAIAAAEQLINIGKLYYVVDVDVYRYPIVIGTLGHETPIPSAFYVSDCSGKKVHSTVEVTRKHYAFPSDEQMLESTRKQTHMIPGSTLQKEEKIRRFRKRFQAPKRSFTSHWVFEMKLFLSESFRP